jgi:hypothetical protein
LPFSSHFAKARLERRDELPVAAGDRVAKIADYRVPASLSGLLPDSSHHVVYRRIVNSVGRMRQRTANQMLNFVRPTGQSLIEILTPLY